MACVLLFVCLLSVRRSKICGFMRGARSLVVSSNFAQMLANLNGMPFLASHPFALYWFAFVPAFALRLSPFPLCFPDLIMKNLYTALVMAVKLANIGAKVRREKRVIVFQMPG